MLRRDYNEDLFKDSTMTFGEHLEELRVALFKSLIGLAITFCIGLFVGNYVVQVITEPLSNALTAYYQQQSSRMVANKLAELEASGKAVPKDPAVLQFAERERLLADEVYIDPKDLAEQLKRDHVLPTDSNARADKPTASPTTTPPAAVDAAKQDPHTADATTDATTGPEDPFAHLTRKDMIRLFLWRPLEEDSRVRPTALSMSESFSIYMKATLLVAVVFAAPWIFYQIWSFVAAGLYPHEKHYVHVFLPFSLGLFLFGVCLAFFFVFKPVLGFLLSFNNWLGIDPDPRISEWLGFVLILPLGFGIAFQLPLVMLFLERIGIFTVQAYMAKWRLSILVIFVLAMILTPSDPYSMLLMAVPLTILFFGGILLCRFMPRRPSPYDDDLPRRSVGSKSSS